MLMFCFSIKGFFVCILSFWYVRSWKTLKRHVFLVMLFVFSPYKVPYMHFGVLVPNKLETFKIHVFGNVVLFIHIECYSRILAFFYLGSWKLIIQVSLNIISFPHTMYFVSILWFWKTLKSRVFGNVFP